MMLLKFSCYRLVSNMQNKSYADTENNKISICEAGEVVGH